jgi:hypothetical protein
MTRSSSTFRRVAGVTLAAGTLLLGGMTVAAPVSASTPFADQARAAGLSTSQIQLLQREVTAYVAQTGGRQVSANRVEFAGGDITVAVPGQRYAHDLATGATATAWPSCTYGDFCAYSGTSGSGTKKAYYACQNVLPFSSGTGSFDNNQTTGTRAYLYRYTSSGSTFLAYTSTARDQHASWSWSGTANVRTC